MATDPSREAPTSVIRVALEDLNRRGHPGWRQTLESWALPGKPQVFVIPLVWVVTFLLTGVFLKNIKLSILPSFAPADPGSVLLTMWQVEAAVTAIAFPFLGLLIELSRQRSMAARPTVEVLTRQTYVMPALMFSIAGTAALGFASSWLASHAIVVSAFFGILIPTMFFLAWCYWTAFRLLSSPILLKEAAYRLLEEKLRKSMDSLWVYRRANSILNSYLPTSNQYSWRDPSRERPERVIPATRAGIITDINARALLNAIPVVEASTQEEQGDEGIDPDQRDLGEATVQMIRLCGDKVSVGDPLVVLDVRGIPIRDDLEEEITSAFRIEEQ